jgi:ribonuclease E
VSRKIEDEDLRRRIREKLDGLNLPDGFGFILRTAGMDKTQTEIKRDIAYLLRLWKVMEKRIEQVGAPCLLYNESDLLVRTIRDVLRPSIDAVIVDSASGHERISAFLKVAAPRSAPTIIRYGDPLPLFHAFDIEKQIEQIHNREVDLPSGGRLVIDQTEALVSIDVNSGRSRRARDSETNAFRTNMEACDAICRQLRLRDLGGLIVNDLIDMALASHRKTVEKRFLDNLERDRARTSILPISRFGLLQMTRQRMRPSVLDSHYVGCTHCAARGQVKSPEQVAADASRHAGWLLRSDRIRRVEIACSPGVASVLMSHRRRELDGYEDATGKRIVVRVSVSIATDHVAYFAYDERGADVDASTIPLQKPPTLDALIEAEKHIDDVEEEDTGSTSRRRRRGRRTPPAADATSIALGGDFDAELASLDKKEEKPKRRRRSGSTREKAEDVTVRVYELAKKLGVRSKEIIDKCGEADIEIRNHMSSLSADIVKKIESLFSAAVGIDATDATESTEGDGESAAPRKRRRRRRGGRRHRKSKAAKDAEVGESEKETGEAAVQETPPDAEKKEKSSKKPRRRRSSGRKRAADSKKSGKKKSTRKKTAKKAATKDLATKVEVKVPPSTGRRTLYGAGRRSITSSEAKSSRREGE